MPRARVMQPVEMCSALAVGYRDLAVDDHRAPERGKPSDRQRELIGHVVAVAALDAQLAIGIDDHKDPPPVVLDLVQPIPALRRERLLSTLLRPCGWFSAMTETGAKPEAVDLRRELLLSAENGRLGTQDRHRPSRARALANNCDSR
jgi:hypothetical protein